MSGTTPSANAAGYGEVRTLAMRVNEAMRAQLDLQAELNDRTVTNKIRIALETWIEKSKSDPSVLQPAEFVRAEIECETDTKRLAIESIFEQQTRRLKRLMWEIAPWRHSAA